ncbi:transcriptional regulator [Longispora fulva]|uniref:Putative DNA-binding transcriptional regulator YafY n=1 Tax=Longispora fulva TaxID=619741 RepID=A0A8J7GJM9_9ACTN|nr:WYL domain-containing protein [Longispora fulva]MBG6137825.1 putative DNA-binding transcriptional regulator YafY [Longispora fulva]GIG62016.1 transcriptional regulator [Longispora fulva]
MRLLSVLLSLQKHGRRTARELAAELEVSVRTIYRDVEALGAAGVPVYAERGPAGGYRLLDGYRTRLTGMTPEEAEALTLVGLPGPAAQLGLGAVLTAAELKLHAALPTTSGRVRERFHLDAAAWFQAADDTPWLGTIADAVWRGVRLTLRYRRWSVPREVTRTVDPLGIVLKAGRWYLVGAAEGTLRTYRVSKVLHAEPLAEECARPEGFDLATHWSEHTAWFEARQYTGEARVRLSPRAVDLIPGMLGTTVARAVAETAGPPDADGWVEATIPVEHPRMAVSDLLRLGADLELLGPPELLAAYSTVVADLARKCLSHPPVNLPAQS